MRRLVVWLVATTGCNSILGIDELADSEVCLGAMRMCAEPVAGPLRFEGVAIDTDAEFRCETRTQASGPDLCLISARTITIVGAVPVIGSRPLVLFASDSLLVTTGATLDVSSKRGGQLGANASTVFCDQGTAPGVDNAAGGGAGGSFGGRGGDGGNGASTGMGGLAANPVPTTALRGGCAGMPGGVYMTSGAAAPGESGGAIALYAGKTITVEATGSVLASGAGAGPSMLRGGGGGGGSGGMIVLDAPSIVIEGHVVAHGGGGGEGATGTNTGAAGEDGPGDFDDVGVGGNGTTSSGGDGGDGSSRTTGAARNGMAGASGGAGGGGGGGAGVILIVGTLSGAAMITPTEP